MENCYVVFHNKDAAIIDPGADADKIINVIGETNNVRYILLTHGHFDHIGAVNILSDYFGVPVMAYAGEVNLLDDINCNLSFQFGSDCCVKIDHPLSDGDYVPLGDKGFYVIHTPGHTAGSCCFLIDDNLFTGDTLFCLSVGRTDLPTGSFESLVMSLTEKLSAVNDCCKVFPGHGNESEMGFERNNNPYFKL